TDRRSQTLGVFQQPHRALQETEVHHRRRDLAVLYEEQPVPRQTRLLQGLRVHAADVPEVGHQQSAIHTRDQLIQRGSAAFHDEAFAPAATSKATSPTSTATATESAARARSRLLAG